MILRGMKYVEYDRGNAFRWAPQSFSPGGEAAGLESEHSPLSIVGSRKESSRLMVQGLLGGSVCSTALTSLLAPSP
jgi:hypothetical protein